MKHELITRKQASKALELGLLEDVSCSNITRLMLASIRASSGPKMEQCNQWLDGYLMVNTGDILCKLYRVPDIYEMIEMLIEKKALPNGAYIRPGAMMHEGLYDAIDAGLEWLQTQNS